MSDDGKTLCEAFRLYHPRGNKAPPYERLSMEVQVAWDCAARDLGEGAEEQSESAAAAVRESVIDLDIAVRFPRTADVAALQKQREDYAPKAYRFSVSGPPVVLPHALEERVRAALDAAGKRGGGEDPSAVLRDIAALLDAWRDDPETHGAPVPGASVVLIREEDRVTLARKPRGKPPIPAGVTHVETEGSASGVTDEKGRTPLLDASEVFGVLAFAVDINGTIRPCDVDGDINIISADVLKIVGIEG